MKILAYIKSLLPMLRKDDIEEDLRISKAEIESTVFPSYQQAAEMFKSSPIKSDTNKAIAEIFYRNFKLNKVGNKGNFVEEINAKLKQVHSCLVFLNNEVESNFGSAVINDGMDAKKALIIRGSDQMFFFNNFSLDLLSYVYNNEMTNIDKNYEATPLLPVVLKNFNQYLVSFVAILNVYGDEKNSFITKFKTVPDVIVSDKTAEALAAVYHENSIDPVSGPLVSGFENNPIYHLRLMIAEWQSNRYKAKQAKKKMLELKLLQLRLMAEGNSDPSIEHQIEYTEERIQKLEFAMAKQEGKA